MNPVYIDPSGAYEFPNREELVEVLSNKVNAIDKGVISEQYNIKDKQEFLQKAEK